MFEIAKLKAGKDKKPPFFYPEYIEMNNEIINYKNDFVFLDACRTGWI